MDAVAHNRTASRGAEGYLSRSTCDRPRAGLYVVVLSMNGSACLSRELWPFRTRSLKSISRRKG